MGKITKIESYVADGKLYVTTKFLSAFLNRSEMQVGRWRKDGMPTEEKVEEVPRRAILYDLKTCIKWVDENISKSESMRTSKTRPREDIVNDSIVPPSLIENIDELPLDEAERRKKIEDLKLAQIKVKQLDGTLIDADDLDKAQQEQKIMHITKLDNDEKMLPILLGLSESQSKLLHEHNEDHLATLTANIKQKYVGEPSNLDVFNEVLETRRRKITPKQMINALKGIQK